jgi:hypothetical protein
VRVESIVSAWAVYLQNRLLCGESYHDFVGEGAGGATVGVRVLVLLGFPPALEHPVMTPDDLAKAGLDALGKKWA